MHDLRMTARNLDLDAKPPSSGYQGLLRPSAEPLPADTVQTLQVLMAQLTARYAHQRLMPLTTDMYLQEWEEMVIEFGVAQFEKSLWTLIRDPDRRPFFPLPDEIRMQLLDDQARVQQAARAREEAWRRENPCNVCGDVGWVNVAPDGDVRKLARCRCRQKPINPNSKAAIA